ncbi:ATP-dependent endonuclease [Dyella jiangningensis]|nr:ATP-dependent endonuclease [Dyella jiangningensis]
MLREVRLQNFRCFDNHRVPLRPRSVAIGRNNAGKSTIVEALRLISVVTERHQALAYRAPPDWSGLPVRDLGVSPARDQFNFAASTVFHRYGEPPAIITATFDNGSEARIYIGPEGVIFAVLRDSHGQVIRTKAEAKSAQLPLVAVMPQVGPVAREETVLTEEYVRRSMSTSLSSHHFRNQLRLYPGLFRAFASLTEETWGELAVLQLDGGRGPEDPLALVVRDGNFAAEIAAMGHGLQMWLQTMWFLSRIPKDATVILDEPDVYMHPDLQRRLIRYLQREYRQSIVTTHSVEIISEVPTESILVIDRTLPVSRFATSLESVQSVIERVGSAQNLQLARLWSARKCLLVEGKDARLLSAIHNVLYPNDQDGLAQVPNMSLGGWGGWQYAVGSRMLLQNAGDERITVYCVLDSDFHSEGQIRERMEQAARHDVCLHIWSRKEIENYLLSAEAITRFISSRVAIRTQPPTVEEIVRALDAFAHQQHDEVFDLIATEVLAADRKLTPGRANKMAREIIAPRWETFDGRMGVISGKAALAHMSQWSHENFGVAINQLSLAQSMRIQEIDQEMVEVVRVIHDGRRF